MLIPRNAGVLTQEELEKQEAQAVVEAVEEYKAGRLTAWELLVVVYQTGRPFCEEES